MNFLRLKRVTFQTRRHHAYAVVPKYFSHPVLDSSYESSLVEVIGRWLMELQRSG